jgi:hypothetical protein
VAAHQPMCETVPELPDRGVLGALSLALTSHSRSGPGVSCAHLRRLRRDPVPYRR